MDQGRYTKYSTRRIPSPKRIVRIPGSFDDRNRYIRCWHCGVIVDLDRYTGNSPGPGTVISDFGTGQYTPDDSLALLGTLDTELAILSTGPDGTADNSTYTPRMAEAVPGACWFCGCTNLL